MTLTISKSIKLYGDKRILSVFLLGIASGLPWVLIGSALTIWLKESGVNRAEIGFAGLIFVVYAINFFWAPLVDRVRLPLLNQWLHKRKAWISACQLAMILCCYSLSFLSPTLNLIAMMLIALGIALCSATQDIAIDAYRIDSFSGDERALMSTAAGAASSGWWTGYAGLGFIPLYLSDHGWYWHEIYKLLALIIAVVAVVALTLPKPKYTVSSRNEEQQTKTYLALIVSQSLSQKLGFYTLLFSPLLLTIWSLSGSPGLPGSVSGAVYYVPCLIISGLCLGLLAAFVIAKKIRNQTDSNTTNATGADRICAGVLESISEPIAHFFSRNEFRVATQILLFIFLFKIGEAFLGRMSIVFYKEIGYSNTDIATYSKMLTWWVTVVSALLAGVINSKLGLMRSLFISGAFMALSNLMFSWIALSGPSIPLFIATIVVDGIASAWSIVSFVAFISALCNHAFSASQYALLASLGNLGRTTLASLSGSVVDLLNGNWALFFLLTALMVIPGMLLLYKLSQNPRFQFETES